MEQKKDLQSPCLKEKKTKTVRLKLIFSSLVLFIIAVGFNALFNLNSFDKLYIESNVSQYRVIGENLQRHLELGLQYGKRLNHLIGIDRLLWKTKQRILHKVAGERNTVEMPEAILNAGDITVSVASPDGTILYSDHPDLIHTKLPDVARMDDSGKQKGKKASLNADYIKYNNTYITILPIRDGQKNLAGTIAIFFKEKQIKVFLESLYKKSIRPVFLISAFGLILLIGLLYFLTPADQDIHNGGKKKVYLIIFLVISAVQITTSGLSTHVFKNHFIKIFYNSDVVD